MPVDRETLRQIEHLLRPIRNRIGNSSARAVVFLVDDNKQQQLLQVGALAEETLEGAEHFHPYGFSSVPLPGAEAVVVFPNGDRAHALVIGVSDRRHRPTGGEPGEVTVYNDAGASLTMTRDGDIIGQPAPGRQFLIRDEGGDVEPVVKRSEFLKHGHATAATGPVSPPMVAPAPALALPDFPGTETLRAK